MTHGERETEHSYDEGPMAEQPLEELEALWGEDPPSDVASYSRMIENMSGVKPLKAIGYVGRGKAYLERGEPLRAIRDFTAAIELEPDRLMAYLKRADAYYEVGHFKAAIADATHVIRSQWDYSSSAYIIRGRALTSSLAKLSSLPPTSTRPWNLTRTHPPGSAVASPALLGDEEGALADYSAAIRVDPRNSWAFERRGRLYLKRGDCEPALADFTEAIRLEPGNARAYCGRGCVRLMQRQFELAIPDLTEAIALDPRTFRAHLSRGQAYFMRRRFHCALADLTEAIHQEPKHAEIHLLRGVVYLQLNDKTKSAADFRTFHRLRK